MRKPIVLMMSVVSVLAVLALATAVSASAAQRIDMKVLVLGTSATEPDFVSWQSALQREGVPFQAIVTSPGHQAITASTLSDTLANGTAEAKYEAVIVAVGGLPECTSTCASTLSTAEWTALEEYEHTFNVRQLTGDVFPGAAYGLNGPTVSGALDGTQGTLTSEGKAVFPYLKELVGIDTGTYGYEATPLTTQVTGASFQTLVSGPNGSALVGIYTHPNGTQEMVESFNQNSSQLQAELLRHGALNWVTRGVYFGDQRNYVEMDIDDTFTPDDSWDTATHQINYDNNDALRMQPVDVDYAAKWEKEHGGFRMEQLFNGGGSVEYQANNGGVDPVLAEFQKEDPETKKPYADSFGWLSHTYDTPYLDVGCATQNYIEAQLNENTEWAAAKPGTTPGTGGLGLAETIEPTLALGTENPKVFVPGNHSGFANLVPGNPATVDEPDLDPSTVNASGGTLPAGSYQYAVTDQFTNSPSAGQSAAYITEPLTVPAGGSVTLEWESICHAADYLIYREVAGSNKWSLIKTVSTPFSAVLPDNSVGEATSTTNVTGGGESQQTLVDTGAAGTGEPSGWTPPSTENAVESPWEQNPYFIPALEGVGITAVGDDASKAYPDPANAEFGIGATYKGPEYAAGETFLEGKAQVVPRHPINIYYNNSTEAQAVDEYNTLYLPPSLGGECVASSTTTCETAPATFAGIVNSVVSGMFQNMMGNDPRPSYVHQTNIIGHPPAGPATTGTPPNTPEKTGDGLLYSVLNPLLEEYGQYFASSAPYEQLTLGAIGTLLGEQAAWKAALTAGTVSGYIEGSKITLTNSGSSAISAPLTGVSGVGTLYGGIQSGWTSLPVAASTYVAPAAWPAPSSEAPSVATNPASKTVTAGEGASFTATGSGIPAPTVQWQVSTNSGVSFENDTTDAGNTTGTLTVASTTTALSGRQYRAVFTNASGSATSSAATLTVNAKTEAPKVTTSPAAKTVTAGESASFTVAGTGLPVPTVQWQVSTNAGVTYANDTTDAGSTTSKLTVANTAAALSGLEYRAVFTNSAGSATSAAATLTVVPTNSYEKVVDSFGPAIYWPLADAAGSTGAADLSGNRDIGAFSSSGITYQTPSPVEGSSGQGLTLSSGHVSSTLPQAAPSVYTQALWFKTTTAGGALATFGNSPSGANGDQDRMVYMTSTGHLDFGVWTGKTNVIQSPGSYNDGKWHFLVATQGSDGMHLYIDGAQVATGSTTTAQSYTGYWQLGIAANGGWPNETSTSFSGSLSDAAEYVKELTSAQVLAEYQASTAAPVYVSSVLTSHPSTYWRLSDASGASGALDSSGNGDTGNYSSSGVTYGVSSPVEGSGGLGVTLSTAGHLFSSKAMAAPSVYTQALWFKTTTAGGALATFGNSPSGPNGDQDRMVYMTSTGHLDFGVWTGKTNVIQSPGSYNDGKWHFLVATQGSDGMHLYIDGAQVATGSTTTAQSYTGYWQLGIAANGGWPNETSTSFSGSLSDAALWAGTELGASQIAGLYAAG